MNNKFAITHIQTHAQILTINYMQAHAHKRLRGSSVRASQSLARIRTRRILCVLMDDLSLTLNHHHTHLLIITWRPPMALPPSMLSDNTSWDCVRALCLDCDMYMLPIPRWLYVCGVSIHQLTIAYLIVHLFDWQFIDRSHLVCKSSCGAKWAVSHSFEDHQMSVCVCVNIIPRYFQRIYHTSGAFAFDGLHNNGI